MSQPPRVFQNLGLVNPDMGKERTRINYMLRPTSHKLYWGYDGSRL